MTELSRWHFDKYVHRPGGDRFEMPALPQFPAFGIKNPMSADPYWIVEACYGTDDESTGAASFGHCYSLEEAQAQLAELLTHTDRDGRLTDWVIVEYTPTIVGRVVHREPVREPINEVTS